MHTPWGSAQTQKILAPGIVSVSTASHGGIHVEKDLNKMIPEYMRTEDGWYEEDVDWAIVATVFPHAFTKEDREHAKNTLRNSIPMAYELYYKEVIAPGDSRAKDQIAFNVLHKKDYIVVSAIGDWHAGVPKGHVVVHASRGGRLESGALPKDSDWFVVPAAEYDDRSPFGFVIDESRHPRIKFEG